jgi:hypothetical protein
MSVDELRRLIVEWATCAWPDTDDARAIRDRDEALALIDRLARDSDTLSNAATEPEIEITEQMIEAGARVLCDAYDDINDWLARERAASVYAAMCALAPSRKAR